MSESAVCPTDVGLYKQLLLDMALERSVDNVLKRVVEQMASRPQVALARIWLLGPGDICNSCHLRDECPDQTTCLHLYAF